MSNIRPRNAKKGAKALSPTGDLGKFQIPQEDSAGKFKARGRQEFASHYLPATSLSMSRGMVPMQETRVAPGVGAQRTKSNSAAWKQAAIASDETIKGTGMVNMQMASVTDVPCSMTPLGAKPISRFAATVSEDSKQGIATDPSLLKVRQSMQSTIFEGKDAPKSARWAATVRTTNAKNQMAKDSTSLPLREVPQDSDGLY